MTSTNTSNRIYTLDYLRGITALGILLYHYSFWYNGNHNLFTVLNFVGLYGVSIFYILSGLTLYKVYAERAFDSKAFFLKRIFRIYPLLWLASYASIFLYKQAIDPYKIVINFSGVFGLFDWNNYIAVGAWSIGNELCFYLTFPIQLYLINKKTFLFFIQYSLQAIVYLMFAYVWLNPAKDLPSQWDIYINPLNQVFLFSTGIVIAKYFNFNIISKIPYYIFLPVVIATIEFALNTSFGIRLITEHFRIALTLFSIIIAIYFMNQTNLKIKFLHSFFKTTGEISYSLYLLHPIIYFSLGAVFHKLFTNTFHPMIHFVSAIVLTYIIGYIVFEYFEKYFIKKGNQFTDSLNTTK